MKRQFLALRIISLFYKVLAVFALIGMVIAIGWILLNATEFPTMQSKFQPIGIALGSGIASTLVLLAVAQLIDLLIAIETNTRASTALLQQLGRIMKERL